MLFVQKCIYFQHFLDRIQLRMDEIVHLWENLVTASGQKGSKLREAAQQQQFNRTVEDIELWLSEVEGQLLSEDYGKVNFLIIYVSDIQEFFRYSFSQIL